MSWFFLLCEPLNFLIGCRCETMSFLFPNIPYGASQTQRHFSMLCRAILLIARYKDVSSKK